MAQMFRQHNRFKVFSSQTLQTLPSIEEMFTLALALLAGLCARSVSAQCNSFGIDIANGGTYYINPASTAPFTFETGFEGTCTTSDTPILQLPDGTQFTCSLIQEVAGANAITTWYLPLQYRMLTSQSN